MARDSAHWAAAHRRSILFLLTVFAIAGGIATFNLPVALFPHVDFPRIVVALDAGDRPADQMLIAITQPVEQTVRAVRGVVSVRSMTTRGSAELSVNFRWGSDMAGALQLVESAVSHALAQLPKGTIFSVRRMDPAVFPVAGYSLTSTSTSLVALRDLAQYELVPLLSTIEGVGSVDVQGGAIAEYRVDVDPNRLAAYGLDLATVATALSASNVLSAAGRIEDRYKLYLMLSDARFHGIDDIGATVIRSSTDGVVQVRDIARVYMATEPQWVKVNADGRDAVLLQIFQQPGGNTVDIVRNVKRVLDDFRSKLPANVVLSKWYDQSELIVESASSVRDAIVIGVILASLVIVIFLRSVRITLIAVLTVPATLAITVLLLYGLGMSFNVMTLGGMAAAVGLIADDAIVMVEHIMRRLRELGPDNRALRNATLWRSATEFSRPLAGSSGATIIIFVPLAFLGGVTGAFFQALALTMVSALMISFVIAWLAVPLLADRLVTASDLRSDEGNWMAQTFHPRYRRIMSLLAARRWALLGVIVAIALVGYVAYRNVGTGFMPHLDEGGFVLDYVAPPGTSLAETDRMLRQAEAILRADPAVETYSRRTGLQLGGGLTEANQGDFFIRLKPFPRAPIEDVMDRVRTRIETEIPRLQIDMILLMEDLIGDLTAVPQPIEIKLFGDDHTALLHLAPQVAARIGAIEGVVDVFDGVVLAGDALTIQVDRTKAAFEGIDPAVVADQAALWFTGAVTTELQESVKRVGIRVWTPQQLRDGERSLNDAWVSAPDGHRIPLLRIATVETQIGQPQITRDNLKTMVPVTARISGRDLGSTIADVRTALATPGLLPAGVYFELGGLYAEQQRAFRGLLAVFTSAVMLVFVMLLYLYERFSVALSILLMPLLATSAVFVGLWLTGTELNITAMMGLTMIVGIVTEVSIFYFSEYQELSEQGMVHAAALVQAGVNRMRPILMTTLTAILALLPLALGLGRGAGMQQPLAIAIISGLIVQAPLALIVMPSLFARFSAPQPIGTSDDNS